jgi:hypothetical protein
MGEEGDTGWCSRDEKGLIMGAFDHFRVQSLQGPWIPPKGLQGGWTTDNLDCRKDLIVLRTDGILERHRHMMEGEEGDFIGYYDDRWTVEATPVYMPNHSGADRIIRIRRKDLQTSAYIPPGILVYRLEFYGGRFYRAVRERQ